MSKFSIRKKDLLGTNEPHLKGSLLDNLEYILLLLSGAAFVLLVLSVTVDIVTRVIGDPTLWIQEISMISFVWLAFLGASAALRRREHFVLVAKSNNATENRIRIAETFNGSVMISVGMVVIIYGLIYFERAFASRLPVSHLPKSVLAGVVPFFGAMLVIFSLERLICGYRNGFVKGAVGGPEVAQSLVPAGDEGI